jgi:hypothetical protein
MLLLGLVPIDLLGDNDRLLRASSGGVTDGLLQLRRNLVERSAGMTIDIAQDESLRGSHRAQGVSLTLLRIDSNPHRRL